MCGYMYMYARACVCVYVWVGVCIRVYARVCGYVCVFLCVYIYVYVHVYVYVQLVLAYLTTISASKHKATTHGDKVCKNPIHKYTRTKTRRIDIAIGPDLHRCRQRIGLGKPLQSY